MASSNQGPSLGSRAGKTSGGSVRLHPEVVAAQARDILSVLLLFRFVNALCVRTFFQPDEYFQALEPAWNLAFGEQSGAWLTWVGIYSSLFVLFSLYLLFFEIISFQKALQKKKGGPSTYTVTGMATSTPLILTPYPFRCRVRMCGSFYGLFSGLSSAPGPHPRCSPEAGPVSVRSPE